LVCGERGGIFWRLVASWRVPRFHRLECAAQTLPVFLVATVAATQVGVAVTLARVVTVAEVPAVILAGVALRVFCVEHIC